MKLLSVAVLMAVAGTVHAGEPEKCGSAVVTAANFMTSTYGAYSKDVQVQVVSVKKSPKENKLAAEVLASTGPHKCAMTYIPALPRDATLDICLWSLQAVSCDTPEVLKRTIVDEPSWITDKATVKAWRDGMQESFKNSFAPADDGAKK